MRRRRKVAAQLGHERTGLLPKSRPWRQIVESIGAVPDQGLSVGILATRVLDRVGDRYRSLLADAPIVTAVKALVSLSKPKKEDEALFGQLRSSEAASSLRVAHAASVLVEACEGNKEHKEIIKRSLIAAIVQRQQKAELAQGGLFEKDVRVLVAWARSDSGAEFCELTRQFFTKVTANYLRYFLDREASSIITSPNERERFDHQIERHVEAVTKFAFETSKIAQSFAAGWYNKNRNKSSIPESEIKRFVRVVSSKIAQEMAVEKSSEERG